MAFDLCLLWLPLACSQCGPMGPILVIYFILYQLSQLAPCTQQGTRNAEHKNSAINIVRVHTATVARWP